MYMNTLYRALHFDNKHLLDQTMQLYARKNEIYSSASKNDSSQNYQFLNWLLTVPNKRLKETTYLQWQVCLLRLWKQVIYTKWYFDAYLLHLACDLESNASNRLLWLMLWDCEILVIEWKWLNWKKWNKKY